MIVLDSQCDRCKHAHRNDRGGFTFKCDAFPQGIPKIMYRRISLLDNQKIYDHRQPYPGDHGIRFEPLPGKRHPLDVIEESTGH